MSNGLRVTLTGDAAMKKKLERLSIEMPLIARRGTREWAQEKLAIAQERAPVKSGKLRDSGKVRITIGKRATLFGQKASKSGDISASIVFGGPDVPYARLRHFYNPKHPDKERFLERTLLEAVPTAGAEIAEKIHLKQAAL